MKHITCCKGCVPPKRYPGCKCHCEEYIAQKKEADEEKTRIDESRRKHMEITGYEIDRTRKWFHDEHLKPKRKRGR